MDLSVYEIDREYLGLMNRLAEVLPNEPTFQQADKYIRGLLSKTERKNGWQLSEYLGYKTPYALQQFLYRSRFSADALRDVAREYIGEKLGEPDGILVVDETGFLKQGKKSCGVKRQYSGTAGRVENCQVGVFLTYASRKGHCPIDRRLYLPEDWTDDPERRTGAGIPETVRFRTKPEMALEMIQSATEAGVPYTWVWQFQLKTGWAESKPRTLHRGFDDRPDRFETEQHYHNTVAVVGTRIGCRRRRTRTHCPTFWDYSGVLSCGIDDRFWAGLICADYCCTGLTKLTLPIIVNILVESGLLTIRADT
jgi:hypothetical protein